MSFIIKLHVKVNLIYLVPFDDIDGLWYCCYFESICKYSDMKFDRSINNLNMRQQPTYNYGEYKPNLIT